MVCKKSVPFSPEVSKTAESQALQTKKILHSPDEGKLKWNVFLAVGDVLIEELEVEGVAEIRRVEEEVQTGKVGVLDVIAPVCAAIVFELEAQEVQRAVLPEIETAGDFPICSVDMVVLILGNRIVVVYKEEGVSPIVIVKALEGSGNTLAVAAQIVKNLKVSLRLGSLSRKQDGSSAEYCKENLFHLGKFG